MYGPDSLRATLAAALNEGASMSAGSITLGEAAEHTAVLTVGCTRCDRAGKYRLETLIARHGETLAFRSCCVCYPKIAQSAHPLALMTCAAFIVRSCPRFSLARRTDRTEFKDADFIAL
jgi:hypothetical protein